MKHFVKIFVVTFFLIFSTHALAEQKIVYFDLKYILNNSSAGKDAQDQLKKMFINNQKNFEKKEKDLKKSEKDLISKQTVISKDDYEKQANELRIKVADYKKDRRQTLDKITNLRANAKEKLLKKINPILEDYLNKNNISIILNKTSVVASQKDADITKTIIDQLNQELPSIKLE
jgi:Skp family chaperone for outer membrane proteins